MRIISGKYSGRQIHAPGNLPVRPTTDFAKGALFNILNNYFEFEKIKVLDLFAGTGNISYEFISRGCEHLAAVDNNYHCVKFIKETLEKLKVPDTVYTRVHKSSAFTFINQCTQPFDIIFADPPFDLEGIEQIYHSTFEKKLLKDNGWLILEHAAKKDLNTLPYFKEKRIYGSLAFSIFVNN